MDDAQLRAQLGRAVRAHRGAQGLTQEQLAEAIGMSVEWVSQIERGIGTPSLEALVRLADALDADAPSLLAAAVGDGRRAPVEALMVEVDRLPDEAVEVVLETARVLRTRWPSS